MSDSTAPPPALPERDADSHKGTYGRVLLVGGSPGMTGAIALSGMAALRSGAGLVTVAAPQGGIATIAAHEPCYMTLGLPENSDGRIGAAAEETLRTQLPAANSVAIGPGIGRSAALTRLVATWYEQVAQPMVLDADGLNALADCPQLSTLTPAGPRILTPHPGEFARLLHAWNPEAFPGPQTETDDASPSARLSRRRMEQEAKTMADELGVLIVLKGHHTLITDGQTSFHNRTGNPGMATGGCGDVLTGTIAALLGQGPSPLAATRLAVHIHGLAGDLAAERWGQISMTALDVCHALGAAFQQHQKA